MNYHPLAKTTLAFIDRYKSVLFQLEKLQKKGINHRQTIYLISDAKKRA